MGSWARGASGKTGQMVAMDLLTTSYMTESLQLPCNKTPTPCLLDLGDLGLDTSWDFSHQPLLTVLDSEHLKLQPLLLYLTYEQGNSSG